MFIENSLMADHYIIGILVLTLCAFVAGFLDSIAGGAGLVLVPSFIIAGIPPQIALGQEKLVSTIGTFSAIFNYFNNKKIIWKIVLYGVPAALIGSFIGGKVILSFDEAIVGIIIFALIPVGFLLSFIKKKEITEDFKLSKKMMYLILPIVCLAIGFYDGFFGPGTGSFLIIALNYIVGLSLIQSSATAKIFNLSSNIGAFIIFFISGKMLLLIGIPMIIASVLGNYVGSKLSLKNGDKIIKPLIATSILILFITLGFKYAGTALDILKTTIFN